MLDFLTWRELVTAFIKVEARRGGWQVVALQRSKSTRSVYVKLEHESGATARVRVSDHAASGRPESELHVKRTTMGRLAALPAWLAGRIGLRRAKKILPSEGHPAPGGEGIGWHRPFGAGRAERVEFPRSEGSAQRRSE